MIRLDYVGVLFCNELYLNKFSVFFELFALLSEQLVQNGSFELCTSRKTIDTIRP